jgi:hypothetical protein
MVAQIRSSSPPACSEPTKLNAAFIGPTVCKLDGPMPILNRSKTLRDIASLR